MKTVIVGVVSALAVAGCMSTKNSKNSVTSGSFGQTADGTPVEIYTLRNAGGMEARILTYGGIVQSLKVPDRNGAFGDVDLGYATTTG
jgi:aldose 1-epimerase